MRTQNDIPTVGLYGEENQLPDFVHCEDLSARAPKYDWKISAHRHRQMSQLFVLSEGWVLAKVDGAAYHVSGGAFLYVPEHCVHELTFRAETTGHVFSFPLNVVSAIGPHPSDILEMLTRPLSAPASERMLRSAEILREEAQSVTPFRAQQVVSMAHSLIVHVAEVQYLSSWHSSNPELNRIRLLDSLIARHMAAGWGARDYANALSMTTGHLSRICRQATGLGATAYLEQKTINEGCRLLAFTQLPIAEVGFRLGFSDPSYFSKRFKIVRGQSPSQYRALFTGDGEV